MQLTVQSEASVHSCNLRLHEIPTLRGPWSEVHPAVDSPFPFVIVGMAVLDGEGGKVLVKVGYGEPGEEIRVAEVRLPVDVPPFDPQIRGLTEPILMPSRRRIVAAVVRVR